MVYGVGCWVFGVELRVRGVVFGVDGVMCRGWYLVLMVQSGGFDLDVWCLVYRSWYLMLRVQSMVCGVWCLVCRGWYLAVRVQGWGGYLQKPEREDEAEPPVKIEREDG